MSIFDECYNILIKFEGLYSNDPEDLGGETVLGICRKYDKISEIWKIVDQYKSLPNFPDCLKQPEIYIKLVNAAKPYYKKIYWDKFNLDDSRYPKELCWEIFDISVNNGIPTVTKFIQEICNGTNKQGTLWPDIIVDGDFGPGTQKAMEEFFKTAKNYGYNPYICLSKLVNILQGSKYFDIMKKNESQEKFAWGWLSRVL